MRLFISYSRANTPLVDVLSARLESAGHEISIDRRDLPFGEEWQAELTELIRGADTTIWLVSRASVSSSWCNWELGEAQRLKKRILPVRADDVDPTALPEALGRLHLMPAIGTFEPNRDMDLLLNAIATDRNWLREHTRLGDRAREWRSRGEPNDLLLRGTALDRAESWSGNPPSAAVEPTHDTMALILQSRDASNRSLRRQRGVAVAVSLVALILSAAAIWGAIAAMRQSAISDGLRVAAEDRAIATAEQRAVLLAGLADQQESPVQRTLVALEGWSGSGGDFPGFATIDASQRARSGVPKTLETLPSLGAGDAPDFPTLAAIIAANLDEVAELRRFGDWEQGKASDYRAGRIAVVHEAGRMVIQSLDGKSTVQGTLTLADGAKVDDVALSPDGAFLVVSSDKGDLVTVDARSGGTVLHQSIGSGSLHPLAFHESGAGLAFTVPDGRLGIVDFERVREEEGLDEARRSG